MEEVTRDGKTLVTTKIETATRDTIIPDRTCIDNHFYTQLGSLLPSTAGPEHTLGPNKARSTRPE